MLVLETISEAQVGFLLGRVGCSYWLCYSRFLPNNAEVGKNKILKPSESWQTSFRSFDHVNLIENDSLQISFL